MTWKVQGVELKKVDKFYFDENQRAILELVEGTEEIVSVDNVIFAVGQRPEGTDGMDLELINNSYIKVDNNLKTNIEGIYAAGDVVTGTKSVIEAITAGRKSAEKIDKYLGGDGDITEQLLEDEITDPYIGQCPGFGDLERNSPSAIGLDKRKCSFETVEDVFEKELAMKEADRCLQCDLRLDLNKPKFWNEY